MNQKRVVVTGIGISAPLALETELFWKRLVDGKSVIGDITPLNPLYGTCFSNIGSLFKKEEITDENLRLSAEDLGYNLKEKESMNKYRTLFKRGEHFSRIAFHAARQAIEDSKILLEGDLEKILMSTGCAVGGGFGGISTIESASARIAQTQSILKLNPITLSVTALPGTAPATIAEHYGFHSGLMPSLAAACASGGANISYGVDKIRLGKSLIYICGGTGEHSPLSIGGFGSLKSLSPNSSRPFDRDRDGFVFGEGAGVLVIEELEHAKSRDAHIYAEILGYGETDDGGHSTQPHPEGKYLAMAIREALNEGGIAPEQINYINLHGTSTRLNDVAETKALKKVFGDYAYQIPMSSSKGAIGHTLNAAGAIELAITILAMKYSKIPLTLNLKNPDPECDLDYTMGESKEDVEINYALSQSIGFRGRNSSILVGKYAR